MVAVPPAALRIRPGRRHVSGVCRQGGLAYGSIHLGLRTDREHDLTRPSPRRRICRPMRQSPSLAHRGYDFAHSRRNAPRPRRMAGSSMPMVTGWRSVISTPQISRNKVSQTCRKIPATALSNWRSRPARRQAAFPRTPTIRSGERPQDRARACRNRTAAPLPATTSPSSLAPDEWRQASARCSAPAALSGAPSGCTTILPPHMIPARPEIDAFPLTGTGKIDRLP